MLIQSVFIDRQIKQDMKILHERRGFAYGAAADRSALDTPAGAGLRFYDFKPTPEAKFLFREYVKTKWPIRVFALDPDIDQQNILDAYSQRTELQMALSVALSAGKINFKDAAKYARRLELDMTTIGLNRTSVGFGAGQIHVRLEVLSAGAVTARPEQSDSVNRGAALQWDKARLRPGPPPDRARPYTNASR